MYVCEMCFGLVVLALRVWYEPLPSSRPEGLTDWEELKPQMHDDIDLDYGKQI
jgi:hypothetical protein